MRSPLLLADFLPTITIPFPFIGKKKLQGKFSILSMEIIAEIMIIDLLVYIKFQMK